MNFKSLFLSAFLVLSATCALADSPILGTSLYQLMEETSTSPLHQVLVVTDQTLRNQEFTLVSEEKTELANGVFMVVARYEKDEFLRAFVTATARGILDSNGNSHGVVVLDDLKTTFDVGYTSPRQ